MNLLFVTQELPYLPARDGFRLYAGNILRELARRHRVDLISLLQDDDDQHIDWAQEYCASVSTFSVEKSWIRKPLQFAATFGFGRPLHLRKEITAAIRSGLAESRWDMVHVEGAYVAGLIPYQSSVPKILSVHDSWKVRYEQMAKFGRTRLDRLRNRVLSCVEPRYERLVYPRFDRCVFVAEADARTVCSIVPKATVEVVPNGIDTDYFRPLTQKPPGASLVFHGNFGYPPNVKAAEHFVRQVFPLIRTQSPEVTLRLVGARPHQAVTDLTQQEGVTLFANLPDLREAVASAGIYVCPVQQGAGVKNKLLEAMAMGLPIVCYPESASGIDCIPGKHVLIARNPEMFASAVLWLLRNPHRGAEMAEAARSLVEEHNSWDSRSRAFEQIYQRVLAERGDKLDTAGEPCEALPV